MLLTLTLILLPLIWLAVAVCAVAACRSASKADRQAPQQQGRPRDHAAV